MKRLKKKYSAVKNNYTVGDVIKVFYIVFRKTKRKKKKSYVFIGLCINKKNNYFNLVNVVKKEKIIVSFDKNSPVVYKMLVLKLYKKVIFRVSRLYFRTKNYYFDDYKTKKNIINSTLESFKINYFFSAYLKKKLVKRMRKWRKFRKKYSYTENWRFVKNMVRVEGYGYSDVDDFTENDYY